MATGNDLNQRFIQIERLLEAINEVNNDQLPQSDKYDVIVFLAREIVRVADAANKESIDEDR